MHEPMKAPFGPLVRHASELQKNVIDPRNVQVISLDKPRAFLYKRFMSDAECDFMVVRPAIHTHRAFLRLATRFYLMFHV